MLRITILSLLLGTVAFAVLLTQLFPPDYRAQQNAPAIVWDASKAQVTSGTPKREGNELHIELDGNGIGQFTLAAPSIAANDFSFIHLALEQSARDMLVAVTWTSALGSGASYAYELESRSRHSLWLSTEELRGWDGTIATLGLTFTGSDGDTVKVRDFSIYPASATRQLRSVYSDLAGYAYWNRAAMNTYTGTFNASSFYPVLLAVGLLICSLLAYGLLLFLLRKKLIFNPSVVALIFLTTWIILDLFWQSRLLHQLAETSRTFSGMDTEEKMTKGPDAELFNFVTQTKPMLTSDGSRIFVASSDKYRGMRTAYYFYPLNVYWSLHGAKLPHKRMLHKGDYVVLVKPFPFRFDPQQHQLTAPNVGNLKAELIFSDTSGTVVRLK